MNCLILGLIALLGLILLLLLAGGTAFWWFQSHPIPFLNQTLQEIKNSASAPIVSPTPLSKPTPTTTPKPIATPTPTPKITPTPTPVPSATPKPIVAQSKTTLSTPEAAEQWIFKQSWFQTLTASMPKGVTLSVFAYDDKDTPNAYIVEVREHHAANSGFDPAVSPRIGIFSLGKKDNNIQYLDAISGDYVPLAQFLKEHKISLTTKPTPPKKPTVPSPKKSSETFETSASFIGDNAPEVASVPKEPANHAAILLPNGKTTFSLPLSLATPAADADVIFRILQTEPDPSMSLPLLPEKIKLKVSVIDQNRQVTSRETSFPYSSQWDIFVFNFYDLTAPIVEVKFEASNLLAPVYIDDIALHAHTP